MTAFDQAWDLMKALMSHEIEWDMLSKAEQLNIAELFAGLGGSPLMEYLGQGGWGAGARERGHNVQGWDIAEHLKQGDPNYHIADVNELTAQDVMEAFDGGWLDLLFASPVCTAFTTSNAAYNKGWKQPDNIEEMARPLFEDTQLDIDDARDRFFTENEGRFGSHDQSAEELWKKWVWQNRMKDVFNERRGQEGGAGFSGFVPRSVEELLVMDDGRTRQFQRGKDFTEQLAENIFNSKIEGLKILESTLGLQAGLEEMNRDNPRGKMRSVIENPNSGTMAYIDQISHLPMVTVDAASYREPANSLLYGVPTATDVFEMAPGELPALKPTNIFGEPPEGWMPRPRIPSGRKANAMKDILYSASPRGSKHGGGINAVKGLPANALFPGSPKISDNHMRSVIPYHLGLDMVQALERERGVRAPPSGIANLSHIINANTMPLQSNADRQIAQILSRRQ